MSRGSGGGQEGMYRSSLDAREPQNPTKRAQEGVRRGSGRGQEGVRRSVPALGIRRDCQL
eukprot:915694-Prorocentrum_minimum.AAC.1